MLAYLSSHIIERRLLYATPQQQVYPFDLNTNDWWSGAVVLHKSEGWIFKLSMTTQNLYVDQWMHVCIYNKEWQKLTGHHKFLLTPTYVPGLRFSRTKAARARHRAREFEESVKISYTPIWGSGSEFFFYETVQVQSSLSLSCGPANNTFRQRFARIHQNPGWLASLSIKFTS